MIWIAGKIHSEFAAYLAKRSIPYGIITDSRVKKVPTEAASTIQLSLDDADKLARELATRPIPDITAIMVAGYENYIIPAAQIAAAYNLPGPSISSAHAATDKTIMRQAFLDNAPSVTPDFTEVTSWSTIELFMTTHKFPVMLKPANLMKSLYISKNSNWDELQANYTELTANIDEAYRQQNVTAAPKIIIEEFLVGSMHTVAGFVDANGNAALLPQIADCVRASDIGVDDSYLFGRHLPSRLSVTDQENILDVARQGVAALGLTSCPLHIEIILTSQGPKIIEIGARSGGYRPLMYRDAFDIDLYRAAIDTASGQPVGIRAGKQASSVVIELFPATTGEFVELKNEDLLHSLPSLKKSITKAKPGKRIGPARNGYKAAAIIVLESDNHNQVESDFNVIRDQLQAIVSSS